MHSLSSHYFPPTPAQTKAISLLLNIKKELVPILVPTRELAQPLIKVYELKLKLEALESEISMTGFDETRIRSVLSPEIRKGSQRWKRALRYLQQKVSR